MKKQIEIHLYMEGAGAKTELHTNNTLYVRGLGLMATQIDSMVRDGRLAHRVVVGLTNLEGHVDIDKLLEKLLRAEVAKLMATGVKVDDKSIEAQAILKYV